MTKSNFMEDFVKPFAVLVIICIVVGFLLAYTNSVTEPIITEHKRIEAENTRMTVLPGATGFEEVPVKEGMKVDSIYKETSGLGYVITSSYKGYGGLVKVTVGFDNTGKVVGMSADVSTETTGVGSKAGLSDYTSKYIGKSGSDAGVDIISGATYSSTAVKISVQNAMDALAAIG